MDQAEIDLPYEKQVTLEDLETGERLQIHPPDLREAYRKLVQDYLTSVRRCCSDCDIEYHQINIQDPYERSLVQLINRRSLM